MIKIKRKQCTILSSCHVNSCCQLKERAPLFSLSLPWKLALYAHTKDGRPSAAGTAPNCWFWRTWKQRLTYNSYLIQYPIQGVYWTSETGHTKIDSLLHCSLSYSHCLYLSLEEFSTSHVVIHNNYISLSLLHLRMVEDCDTLLMGKTFPFCIFNNSTNFTGHWLCVCGQYINYAIWALFTHGVILCKWESF